MLQNLKIQVLPVILLFLLTAASLPAQITDDYNFHIQRRQLKGHTRKPVPRNGEFKLSLGSQMLEPGNSSGIAALELDRPDNEDFADPDSPRFFSDSPETIKLRNRSSRNKNRLAPTITLNNSYTDASFEDSATDSLSIKGESGKLQVYGEFEKKLVHQLPAPDKRGEIGTYLRAAISDSDLPPGTSEPSDKNAALASRYYLEAIYSFRPTLKGKVSFKRSMIDTFESEEKLQVEGIVEANRNVLIKAGYNNEVRPEVSEPRSSNDTKVWTEFILKF
jgi:hypothetical protein